MFSQTTFSRIIARPVLCIAAALAAIVAVAPVGAQAAAPPEPTVLAVQPGAVQDATDLFQGGSQPKIPVDFEVKYLGTSGPEAYGWGRTFNFQVTNHGTKQPDHDTGIGMRHEYTVHDALENRYLTYTYHVPGFASGMLLAGQTFQFSVLCPAHPYRKCVSAKATASMDVWHVDSKPSNNSASSN